MSWYALEHTNLLRALDLAQRRGLTGHVWRLPWTMSSYFGWRGHWSDWESTQRTAARAAISGGVPEAAVVPLRVLARIKILDHRYEAAVELLESALAIAVLAEPVERPPDGQQREHRRAVEYYEVVAALERAVGDTWSLARTLSRIGDARDLLGDRAGARRARVEALSLLIEIDHHDADTVRAELEQP